MNDKQMKELIEEVAKEMGKPKLATGESLKFAMKVLKKAENIIPQGQGAKVADALEAMFKAKGIL